MKGRHVTLTLVFLLLGFSLASCGKPSRIQGRVVDEAGVPAAGATVRIEGTAFTAATNGHGDYSLDYAPGDLVIVYEKANHLSDTLRVNIAQKTYFPAKECQLLSIPSVPGFYWLSPSGYVALQGQSVNESYHVTVPPIPGADRVSLLC